jgi:small acid-soluble spore protein F (minor alpha/beta-type SASP)
MVVARGRGMMSDELKYRLADELGFGDTVRQHGWGAITTRDAGNLVKLAIAKAEQMIQGQL